MTDYTIRPYRDTDREDFYRLYKAVFNQTKDDAWFDWKYENNPYVDHVPMIVATTEDQLVGARPFFALPVSLGDGESTVLQPGDTMVHPEHRRNGLFTRMTERAIERYRGEYPLFFNFPNHLSRPGYLNLDWKIVTERPSYYRINRPRNVARARTDRASIRLASLIASPFASGYHSLRDARTPTSDAFEISTTTDVPSVTLDQLYKTHIPEAIHATRDNAFYTWRYSNPDWTYKTYIAKRQNIPVAAIVTGTAETTRSTTTVLTDVAPLINPDSAALTTLISRILSDHQQTDLFAAPHQGIPGSILNQFGFHPDSAFPLSRLTAQTTHVVRSLSGEWSLNGFDLTDPENWLLTFAEKDTF